MPMELRSKLSEVQCFIYLEYIASCIDYDDEDDYHKEIIKNVDIYANEPPGTCESNDNLTSVQQDTIMKFIDKYQDVSAPSHETSG